MSELVVKLLVMLVREGPLDPALKREFESELQCSIEFGGLKPIRRVFILNG